MRHSWTVATDAYPHKSNLKCYSGCPKKICRQYDMKNVILQTNQTMILKQNCNIECYPACPIKIPSLTIYDEQQHQGITLNFCCLGGHQGRWHSEFNLAGNSRTYNIYRYQQRSTHLFEVYSFEGKSFFRHIISQREQFVHFCPGRLLG